MEDRVYGLAKALTRAARAKRESRAINKIFISHCSEDLAIVEPLVELLQISLKTIDGSDIRCSSLPGYEFDSGAELTMRVRKEVKEFSVFLGVITPQSLRSTWVLFELGGRWILGENLIPLIASEDMKPFLHNSPLDNIYVKLYDENRLQKLIEDIARTLDVVLENPSVYKTNLTKLKTTVDDYNSHMASDPSDALAARENNLQPSKDKIATASHYFDPLSDAEITFLLLMAKREQQFPDRPALTVDNLTSNSKMSVTAILHYLNKLIDAKYVRVIYSTFDSDSYYLDDRGRKYLVDKNLV